MKKAVVLLSGGLDSSTAGYLARKDIGKKGELYALTFNYGQVHQREIDSAVVIGGLLEPKEHILMKIEIPTLFADSALTGKGEIRTSGAEEDIPSTWVPQRNSIFLAFAFAYAEIVDADMVYTGFNIKDYSGYPDCRPEFVSAINKALNLASKRFVETGRGIGIEAPLMHKTKCEIVQIGAKLGVPWEHTWSCYKGGGQACGLCDSCRIRRRAFVEAGFIDPIEYEEVNLWMTDLERAREACECWDEDIGCLMDYSEGCPYSEDCRREAEKELDVLAKGK